ncbi:hypothetical protein M2323_001981 [Rhodoblastus acidophilus]|uniref:helicase RepA family protein n=1 Tax=Rhodoblastus acidophilus TaxID=1074 RepID=UPI002224FF24|nr:helicase RepA family protein [Rhodoblastus acidophilus]MCW2285687.1 hypothetical protein [Rhodoblastus acidophilus]MCW2333059.1 hypothetical protein [Rhodoblastus acidophilus]
MHRPLTPAQSPAQPPERIASFKSARDFCAAYEPLSYAIEPIIRSSSLYTLTAKTGSGKTALLISTALAVATGRPDILNKDVERGRVAYIAAENPDDLRMRIMVSAYHLHIDLDELADDLVILDYRVKPEELVKRMKWLADIQPFALVIIDTLAAFFDGADASDNVAGGEFMRRLRPLSHIPGKPSVIVAAHPVKNASDDNLIPYGAGAILNEVDGNLCLTSKGGIATLHWQGKIRGLDFKPAHFRLDIASSPDALDSKGREISLPICRPVTEEASEDREQADINVNIALLRAMIANPTGSQRDWGAAIGKAKSNVNGRLQTLKREKLVEDILGKWRVTDKGQKAVE